MKNCHILSKFDFFQKKEKVKKKGKDIAKVKDKDNPNLVIDAHNEDIRESGVVTSQAVLIVNGRVQRI